MSWAAAAISVSRDSPLPPRRRARSNRQIVAAAARLSDSAAPACGTRTVASATATTSCGRPCASLPNTKATGPLTSVVYSDRANRARPSRGSRMPARPQRLRPPRSSRRCARSGRWKIDPARRAHRLRVVHVDGGGREHDGRRAGGVGRSEDRARVPRVADLVQDGDAAGRRRASRGGHRRRTRRPTIPCGVTVEVSFRGRRPLTCSTVDPALPGARRPARSSSSLDEQGDDRRRVRRERLANPLRALDEEAALLLTEGPFAAAGRPRRPSGS